MDVNTLRAVLTLACFASFVGIFAWAYSRARLESFAQAARLPLEEGDPGESPETSVEGRRSELAPGAGEISR